MARDVAIQAVRHDEETHVRVVVRPKIAVRLGDASGSSSALSPIKGIDCTLNGRPVVSVEAGSFLNEEAYFEFALHGAQAGDKLEVRWTDAAGAKGEGRATLK